MLRELLSLIATGRVASVAGAARELGVGEATVADMLNQLAAAGYVENLSAQLEAASRGEGHSPSAGGKREGHCAGCPMAGSCHGGCFSGSQGTFWSITAKGRAASERTP